MLFSNEEKMQMKNRFKNQDYICERYQTHFGDNSYIWNWMGKLGARFKSMSDTQVQMMAHDVDKWLRLDSRS